eukprot:CAMPEP_0113503518 /NCGR_PEP_ID=MMETSP0014_2-20120614/34200_1 /TAXON_ID=2857 /ORGANISM="Nitzschia sp." /LENGTH=814 /DNA_ID=CAMNT_0000398517 /DNA_START=405 /DNA_END=2849 /DNA_ORIENTATION=+ /assembly_acc=CAM_ASM_000159
MLFPTSDLALHRLFRMLAETTTDGEDHSEFGVHITYEDLYRTIVYFVCIYVCGQFASAVLRMPSLVGEIFSGILLGPPLADFVPNPEAFVLIGEVGLVILVLEAGVDIDLTTLKLVGTRGCMIAVLGSLLPIGIGMLLAWAMNVGDTKAIITAGAVFGPTSLGIALNILKGGGILNTPVGQLIVSAAVIDDMIALVVLSMLETMVGEITVVGILIPIISACLWLILGGYVAIFIAPKIINRFVLSRVNEDYHDKLELGLMFGLLLGLMPATHYTKASYLMGSFLAGLPFCSSEGLHHIFVRQFKRLLQWLMRIFFSASIGFQVPIKDFGDPTVIWQGLVFCFALTGKIGVGFLVPNFTQGRRFTGTHLRDCLVTGFSMAAEGEFAFVIAVFGVDSGLISPDLYASVVLAVLISTIIPPFLLRFTISYYNKKGEERVVNAAQEEALRKHDLEAGGITASTGEAALVAGIKNKTDVFLCIQTQSESRWGLLIKIMGIMQKEGLDVIDHRAWAPRGLSTTLVNEIYAGTSLKVKDGQTCQQALDELMTEIQRALEEVIGQEDAKVKVQRWYPGVVEEIVEEVDEKQHRNVRQRLLKEASAILERKQHIQTTATKAKTVEEILGDSPSGDVEQPAPSVGEASPAGTPVDSGMADVAGLTDLGAAEPQAQKSRPRRRVRSKMRSTPVVGGGLFGETIQARSGREADGRISAMAAPKKTEDMDWDVKKSTGVPAEITINGEVFHISVSRNTYNDLKKGYSAGQTDSRGVPVAGIEITARDDAPVTQRLAGFVRNQPLSQITEESEHGDGMSEISEEKSNA